MLHEDELNSIEFGGLGKKVQRPVPWTAADPLAQPHALDSQVQDLKMAVEEARADGRLLFYILSIRSFPVTPNWAVNLACPHLHVPLFPLFWFSALVGLSPYNTITTLSGHALATAISVGEDEKLATIPWLPMLGVALAAYLPTLLMGKNKRKAEKQRPELFLPQEATADASAEETTPGNPERPHRMRTRSQRGQ